jgi:hypothetical protein
VAVVVVVQVMAGCALVVCGVIVIVWAGSETTPVPFDGKVTCPRASICGISVSGLDSDSTFPPATVTVPADAFWTVTSADKLKLVTLPRDTPDGSVMASVASSTSSGWPTGHDVGTSHAVATVTG